MPDPCATCAFGNAGAAKEPSNRIKSEISALAGTPFWCHHTRSSGEEYRWWGSFRERMEAFFALPRAERKVCEGWKRRVAELKADGHVPFQPGVSSVLRAYQRGLGESALDYLATFVAEKPGPEKEWAREQLKDTLRALKGREE